MSKDSVILPKLQVVSGVLAATGYVLAFVNSMVLGIDVLSGWKFVFYSSLFSLFISGFILLLIFRSNYYRS